MMREIILNVLLSVALISSVLYVSVWGVLYKIYSRLYKAIKYEKYGLRKTK